MKKIICTMAAALLVFASASADEGMWMLPLLQQLNANTMKSLGCRLSAEDIYSVNHSSLKDAVMIFGNGCTAEMISDKGLLVTNHHCGYSSIQKLSSDEHNYLEDGYWAMESDQEIPVEGLTVTFLVSMTDVTGKCSTEEEKALVDAAEADNPNCQAEIETFYNDNVKYLMVYKTFRDVRFVGAPPASVGKFGGETDNWMWPRHTGDFSMFRIYAGKDNEPADYSEDNVPYKPAKSLTISLKGIKEGDFSMIMGFPGSTQRYQTEAQLNQMMELHDISIDARTLRQDIMWKWMEKNPSIRLKYANKYASSANGWKKWIGEKKAFADLGIIEKEHQKEYDFTKWVEKNKARKDAYGTALKDIADGVAAEEEAYKDVQLIGESVFRIELISLYGHLNRAYGQGLKAGKDSVEAFDNALEMLKKDYGDYYMPLDKEEAAALLKFYRDRAKSENYLEGLDGDFATMDIDRYVEDLYANSAFTSYDKLCQTVKEHGRKALNSDPAAILTASVFEAYSKCVKMDNEAENKLDAGSKAFAAGLLEWQKGKPTYPDANFTMRLTYGNVKSYSPQDGIQYRYYTTIYGVIEKENPDNYEFKVPEKLKQLYKKKSYGQYAMEDGNLPCCFLTNNDITGGNSGSPVLNGDGQLIGLAFDGNWESMSSDVMFEPDLQRCICVDIRYVLFLMDKLGGAGYLLKEMNIAR